MPLYQIRCSECKEEDEIFLSVKDFDDLPECCGKKMERVIGAPMSMPDIAPYRSMIDGSMIHGRAQHREHLKRNHCFEVGNEVDSIVKKRDTKIDAESARRRKEFVAYQVDKNFRR